MARYIEIARRHGFGVEEITEDKTGEKPEVVTVDEGNPVKDTADLVAASKEDTDNSGAGTTVAVGEATAPVAEQGTTTVATGAEAPQTPVVATSEGKTSEKQTDVDNSVASNDVSTVDAAAVVSVENKEDKVKEATSDEAIAEAKKKLKDAGDILDKFIESKTGKPSTESAAVTVDTGEATVTVNVENTSGEPVVTGDAATVDPAIPVENNDLTVSTEGWKGFTAGLLGHLLIRYGVGALLGPMSYLGGKAVIGMALNGPLAGKLEQKKKELEILTKEAKKIAEGVESKLISEGKVSKEKLKEKVGEVKLEDVATGMAFGSLLQHGMTAGYASDLEDVIKKIKSKNTEIEELLKTASEKADKTPSTEEHSTSEEEEVKSAVENGTAEPTSDKEAGILEINEGEVIPQNSDAEMVEAKEEMDQASKDLSETVEAVEVMEKTEASVESYYEVVKHCSQRRGIDRMHVVSIGIGLESVLSDFGIEVSKIVPSLESFGLEEEKKETTKRFAAKLKEILAAIMKALAKAYEAVVDKAQELMARAKHWKPGLVTAIKLTKSTLNKNEVNSTVTVPVSVRKALYIGKEGTVSIDTLKANSIIETSHQLIGMAGVLKNVAGITKETFTNILSSSPEAAITSLKKSIAENEKTLVPGTTNTDTPKDFIPPTGYTVLSSTEELPGGKFIVAMAPKNEDGSYDYAKMICGVKPVRPGEEIKENTTIENVTKADIEGILDSLEKIVSSTDKLVDARQASIVLYKGLISAMNNYGKSMTKDFTGTEEQAKEIQALLTKNTILCKANIKLAAGNLDGTIAYMLRGFVAPVLDLTRAAVKK